MATATTKTVYVDPPKPQKVARERVVLELTVNEAETLRAIFERVGGVPYDTRRKYADAMQDALIEAGVEVPKYKTHATNRSVWFEKETFAPEKD